MGRETEEGLRGPRVPCLPLVTEHPVERGTFRTLEGEEFFCGAVISPHIRGQFKQTSVGAVTVRGRNVLPVCATLPSDLWLDCHHLTYGTMFPPYVQLPSLWP